MNFGVSSSKRSKTGIWLGMVVQTYNISYMEGGDKEA
jgi:hypothetical protein